MGDAPTATGRAFDTPLVSVGGRELTPQVHALLRVVRVEESVHLADSFLLSFDDPHFELFDQGVFRLGGKVSIAVRADGAPIEVTSGEITAVAVQPGPTGRHELVVSGLGLEHRLAREVRTRTFQKMTDSSIVQKIAGEHGLQAQTDVSGQPHEYLIQAGTTDLAFLRERAARLGVDLWVQGTTLSFKRRTTSSQQPPRLVFGENLLGFRVRFSAAERADEVEVTGWDPVAKKVIKAKASDVDRGCTAPAAREMSAAARDAAGGPVVRTTSRHSVTTQAEADAVAASLLARTGGSEVVLKGEAVGDPRISAGATVTLDRVGTKLAGDYRVTSVEHLLQPGQPYRTRFTCGAKDPSALVDLLPGGPSTAGPSTGGTAGPGGASVGGGLVSGTVSNNADPEKLGRVKVKLPTLSTTEESGWARIAAPGAGRQRGLQWLPDVGDEVLVGFENGDPSRPVVLGGVWNRPDPPPRPDQVGDGKAKAITLTSRSGHDISIVEEPKPAITAVLKGKGSELTLSEASTSLKGPQKVLVQGQDVEVTAKGTLSLKGASVEIKADGAVTVKGATIKLN